MNNPNPFLPHSSFFQEQKNKARARLRFVVLSSISLSVIVLVALLIQGCRKSDAGQTPDQTGNAPAPELANNPPPETNNEAPANSAATSNPGTLPPPPTEPTTPTAPPQAPPPAPPEQPATSDYTVVKGDTFAVIAKNNHVSVKAIEQANPGVDPKRLKIGQKLHLPAANSTTPNATSSNPGGSPETAALSGGEQTYKVKSGDTLIGIAKKFHVSIKAIQSANDLKTTSIRVGQTLKIPSKAAPAPEAPPAETVPPPAPASTPTMPPPTLQPPTPTNH